MRFRRLRSLLRGTVRLSLAAALAMGAAWWLLPFPVAWLEPPPQATCVVDRQGEPLRVFLAPRSVHQIWVSYEQLGEWLPRAMVAAEDQRFWRHGGVDLLALARAVRQNLVHRRRVSGASTLSTQVIRMVSPGPRTLPTKVREFFLATQMERLLTKREILEQYLNRAPFGANLFGAEAASRRYFGKRACDLSLPEAALLAGLPQSPTRHRPDLHPRSAERRRAYVLERLRATGVITAPQQAAALQAPLPTALVRHPYRAPHFCDELARRLGRPLPGGVLRTTLDATLQREAEEALRDRLADLPDVQGGAIVVLDTATAEIRALVGSPRSDDLRRAGQFNHALAWRSPGSALKPFAYALALDQGRITPATALADIPRQFTAYQPVNFDGGHRGVVSAREALVQSLNLPALDLVRACSAEAFHQRLTQLGIAARTPRDAAQLGIGAVLGNTEVRLLDLTAAYATLGRGGRAIAPIFGPDAVPGGYGPVSAVSPAAAWIVLDMLSGEERTAVVTGHHADVARPRVAWKTGTSSGLRDAWTVAVTPGYTVGVWLGNSDGRPAASLLGLTAAAPVAFNLLARIGDPARAAAWFERPDDVRAATVCAVSGLRPCEDCPRRTTTWEIAGVTRPERCRVHRRVVAADGRSNVEEVWPDEIAAFLRTHRSGTGAGTAAATEAPRVATPAPHEVFRLTGASSGARGLLPLRASGAAPLHWFLDGTYVGSTGDAAPLPCRLTLGPHTVLCCDALGRATAVQFLVE